MPNFSYLASKWDSYSFPWRPWNNTIIEIKKHIFPTSKVCILWATVELRKVCRDIGCKVDVYDISTEMLQKDDFHNSNESIYNVNWFEIDKYKYDIIIWDLILWFLEETGQKKLFRLLQKILSPQGYFILRNASPLESDICLDIYIHNVFKKHYGLRLWNQITFDLVIWKGFSPTDIRKIIWKVDLKKKQEFIQNFWDLVPYGKEKFHTFCKESQLRKDEYLLQESFTYTQEQLIKIKKNRIHDFF